MTTIRKIIAVLAATVALVGGLAAPASARIADPDALPTLAVPTRCTVVSQGQFGYQLRCGHALQTYKWNARTGRYVLVSIRSVR